MIYHLDLIFSSGFLVRELGVASATSGFTTIDSAVWLVEPLRTKSFDKFTGTLQHPSPERQDKCGLTIAAFTHHVYETSNRTIVFADLQGKFYILAHLYHVLNAVLYLSRISHGHQWP